MCLKDLSYGKIKCSNLFGAFFYIYASVNDIAVSSLHFYQDLPSEVLPSVVEELQKRVLIAEATIEQNEKENAALKEQVKQFEARWSEYEAKMSSMEEGWRKKMLSLQVRHHINQYNYNIFLYLHVSPC